MLNFDGRPADRGVLRRMISTLSHRGPDADGIHVDGSVGLAHARLSIIDLQTGGQPMSATDGRLWITFNGEIFNYVELREELVAKGHAFATRSDTEVILNAYREWGDDCVKHFNGQWSFAIWDSVERTLFASRDRMGIRPLFYTQTPNGFFFASEMKALLASGAVPAEFDAVGMDQVFTFWMSLPPRTVLKNILQLPPAHSLTVSDGEVRVHEYWTPSFSRQAESIAVDEQEAGKQLLHLLCDATRIRLRSDVPVGAYLSGGIDSTLTTALVRRIAGDRLRSFSIAFHDKDYDESAYQLEASKFLGTQHSCVTCSSADVARVFPDVIRSAEQPIVRTAPAPMFLLSRLVHESGFKVVLTGEGADEVLGGYDIFKEAKIRRFWAHNLNSKWRPLLLKRMYPYLKDFQKQSAENLKHFFRVTPEDLASPLFSHLPRWELTSRLKLLFSRDFAAQIGKYDPLEELRESLPADFGSWTHLSQAQYLEAKYFLPGYLLSSQGDRMAMAHSVEGRYPFLDYRVVEFASKLPDRLKLRVLNEKYLLKQICKGMIPESILRRVKQPYRAPDSRCFFGESAPEYVNELTTAASVSAAGVFDSHAVGALVAKFNAGKANSVKDDMALVGVLSSQILAQEFVNP
jgi:asparagine synthase (glutamine-hydrolysing)